MGGYFLSMKAFSLVVAVALVAAFAAGCGGGGDEIEVETGTLTKAEFAKRANGVCKVVRIQFAKDFSNYYKDHSPKSVGSEKEWAEGVIDKAVLPNYEVELIAKLSALGVPSSEKDEIVAFLEALQQRLDELKENADELTESPFPFRKPAALAEKTGLVGCAAIFS